MEWEGNSERVSKCDGGFVKESFRKHFEIGRR